MGVRVSLFETCAHTRACWLAVRTCQRRRPFPNRSVVWNGFHHGGCRRVPIPPDTAQPWALAGVTDSAVSVGLKWSPGALHVPALVTEMQTYPRVYWPFPRPPLGTADVCPW